MTGPTLHHVTAADGVGAEAEEDSAASRFRTDIDGLRAVAVLAVVGYHARIPGLTGGFVGVDVFFVISGFLITRNLLHERATTGGVALWAFWGRRLRRLAPALGLVVLATLAAALVVLSPLEWRAVATDGGAAAVYVSNLVFAREATDYFADGSASLFLHTWSLAVEEQFYLAWPIVAAATLAVGARRGRAAARSFALVSLVVAVTSLALSVVLTRRGTPWAFFSLPTRAWQFALAGVLAALLPSWRVPRPFQACLGWAGLVAVTWSALTFDGLTPYPGTAALLPTAGALALIASGGRAPRPGLDAALAWGPVQFLGRVSYSWYLWHWPVLLLTVIATDRDTLPVRVAAMAAALGLGWLSYRLVEQPIRLAPRLVRSPSWSLAVGAACAVLALVAAAAVVVTARHELRDPFLADLQRAAADRGDESGCRRTPTTGDACVYGPAEATRTVLVAGDSHAASWGPAFAAAVRPGPGAVPDTRVVIRSYGGCPSVDVAVARQGTRDTSDACRRYRAETEALTRSLTPDLVVLANASYLGRVLTGPGTVGSGAEQVATWSSAVRTHVRALTAAGRPVALLLNGPLLDRDPITCIGRKRSVAACTPSRTTALRDVEPFRRVELAALRTEAPGAAVLDTAGLLCDRTTCRLRAGGTYTMFDVDHVTASFARAQGPAVAGLLRAGLAVGR